MPKNLRLLSERLPKSNYGSKKSRGENKHGPMDANSSASLENTSQTESAKHNLSRNLHSIREETELSDNKHSKLQDHLIVDYSPKGVELPVSNEKDSVKSDI